jgi:hypothetical protein
MFNNTKYFVFSYEAGIGNRIAQGKVSLVIINC